MPNKPEIATIPIVTFDGKFGDIPYADALKNAPGSYVEVDPTLDLSEDGTFNVVSPDGKKMSIGKQDLVSALGTGYQLESQIDKKSRVASLLASPNAQKLAEEQKNTQGLFANLGSQYDFATQEEAQAAEDKAFKEMQDKENKDKLRAVGKVVSEGSAALTAGLGPILGSYILKDPEETIKVIDPKDSTVKEISKKEIADFANKNPDFRFYNPIDQDHWEAEKEFAKLYDPSLRQVQAGANAAIKGLTAGFVDPKALEGSSGIRQAVEKQEEAQYAKTQIAGELLGLGVGLAASGGAGVFGEISAASKAAQGVKGLIAGPGAGLARQAAGFVGSKLAEGAILTAPTTIAKALIDEDIKGAAENLLLGSTINLGFGLVGKAISSPFNAITAASKNAIVDKIISKDLSATEDMLLRLGTQEQKKEFIDVLNKVTGNKTTRKELVNGLTEIAEGSHMKDVIAKLDPLVDKEIKSGTSLVSTIKQEVDKIEPQFAGQLSKKQAEEIGMKVYETLGKTAGKDGTLSLPEIQKFITKVGEEINYGKISTIEGEAANQVKINIRNAAIEELHKAADSAALKAPANLASDWTKVKAASEMAVKLQGELAASSKLGDKVFNKALDLMEASISKKVSSTIGSVIGGPIGALTGGGFVGGAIGTAVGGAVGHAVSSKAEPLVKDFVEKIRSSNTVIPTKLNSFFQKHLENPYLSSYIAIDAIHAAKAKADSVGKVITNMSTKSAPSIAEKAKSPIALALGDEANGLSKQQQFAKYAAQLSKLEGNPELKQMHVNDIVSAFAKDHPQLAEQMRADLNNRIQYLHQIMPKNNNPPKPFVKNDKWQPTKAQLDEFEAQLKVAHNPYLLVEKLKDGKITAKEVATAAMLNPAVLQTIRDRIAIEAYSGKANLTYQQRLNTSLLMGQAMDDSLKKVQQLQQTYGNQPPANAGGQVQTSSGRRGGSGSKIKAADLPSSKATSAQRIAGK